MSLEQTNGHSGFRIVPATLRSPLPPAALNPISSPFLYSTLLGNGGLLVAMDSAGELAQLFYPHIDVGPHLRVLHWGVNVSRDTGATAATRRNAGSDQGDLVSWLGEPDWKHTLQHIENTAAVQVVSIHAGFGLRVERRIAVHPLDDVCLVEFSIRNLSSIPLHCALVTYAAFDVNYRRSGTTCYYQEDDAALLFFAGDQYFAFVTNAAVDGYSCQKTTPGAVDELFAEVSRGEYSYQTCVNGQVGGAVRYDLGRVNGFGDSLSCYQYLCCGSSLPDTLGLAQTVKSRPLEFTIAEAVDWWQHQYTGFHLPARSQVAQDVYRRSLITLQLLTDRATGACIASAETDPDFRTCDGYAYCWPRDGAFTAWALDSVGLLEQSRAYHNWALRAQEPSGGWYQRYSTTGKWGPSWGFIQFDETGASVWALCRHVQVSGDLEYGRSAFSQLIRACTYMQNALDAGTGLAPITKDLWEERDGISTYACATTWGAFHEVSVLASMLGESREAEHWALAASDLKKAIQQHLWDPALGRFLRGLNLQFTPREAEKLRRVDPHVDLVEDITSSYQRFIQARDATIDSSLLALSLPFEVFSPSDPTMVATADAIAHQLTGPTGGVLRYAGDAYRGGNEWVISTLWSAWHELAVGRYEVACRLFQWVLDHRSALDLLPEQVDQDGRPCWVLPLGWSHAFYLLVATKLAASQLI